MIRFYLRRRLNMMGRGKPFLMLAVGILLSIALLYSPSAPSGQGNGPDRVKQILAIAGVDSQTYKNILRSGLPPVHRQADLPPEGYVTAFMRAVFNVDLANPRSLFGQGMTAVGAMEALAASQVESYPLFEDESIVEIPDVPPEEPQAPVPEPEPPVQAVAEGAEVIIINTHNAETYRATDGVSKKEGENAGVVKAAAHLENVLQQKYRMRTERSETIHDYPEFEKSYTNAAVTLEDMLKRNPQARVVIDVHRDAGQSKPLTATINGRKTAQIRLIVGSDARLPHPGWMQNREFARQLAEKMDELYPGLSLGYRVQSGRYNQHLHPRAVLLEVGNDLNSLDEALAAVELFADVLYQVLRNTEV
ncbi:MAG TPA: hypothetical protein GXX34_09140 [Clostridia bacterium]|nr:hypothetical protein [Clostridia bacterium]